MRLRTCHSSRRAKQTLRDGWPADLFAWIDLGLGTLRFGQEAQDPAQRRRVCGESASMPIAETLTKPSNGAPEVVLVPVCAAHAPAMVGWLQDPSVATNLGLRTTPTLEKTLAFIADAVAAESSPNSQGPYAWAILLEGRHIGTVVLDQFDRDVGKARLHIYVGDATARGRGVGRRVVALVVESAFGRLGLSEVWLTVHAKNLAGIRAYQAIGFTVQEVRQGAFLLGDERVDELYMTCLASTLGGLDATAPSR